MRESLVVRDDKYQKEIDRLLDRIGKDREKVQQLFVQRQLDDLQEQCRLAREAKAKKATAKKKSA